VPFQDGAGMEKIRVEQHSCLGILWFAGWLFTIGFIKLGFWQGVLALVIWPYHIGSWVAGLAT
jgi:hypothetical protein